MRILVYKRTHTGDPDQHGCFDASDCMGVVRHRSFDAVIGVGGIGPDARAWAIAGRINWIGKGPHKVEAGKRGPEVTFDHFRDFGTDGPDFRAEAPRLAERMYSNNVRHLMDGLSEQEHREAMAILAMVMNASPSPGHLVTHYPVGRLRRCGAKRRADPC